MVRLVLAIVLSLAFALPATAPAMAGAKLAKQLFGAKKSPSHQKPAPYGSYAKGCQGGAVQLPETGPAWQAMRLSRNRNWGQPGTIDFIEKLSAKVARLPGTKGLYIGDISQPRGGPMLSGHRSHQIGLDVDIWLRAANDMNLSRKAREKISAISMRRANGAYVNDKWSELQFQILKAAAKDKRVARIFIFPGAKVWMCKHEKGNRAWLRKIRPWWGHHYHFHVRLKCPRGMRACVDQPPPPRGDGCKDAEKWVYDILHPKPRDPDAPPPRKRREYVLSDLPDQCAAVLRSR